MAEPSATNPDSERPDTQERVVTPSTPENVSDKEISAEKTLAKHQEADVDNDPEPQPHLHARTFLAVFAMCLIYFAQDFALVGAGSVSLCSFHR